MEVLRATEILEREINESAKVKADHILAKAEAECKQIAEDIDKRIGSMEAGMEASFKKQAAALKMKMEAAISLEQGRFLVEYTDKTIMSAISNYLNALDEKKQLQLVQEQLKKFKPILDGRKIVAQVVGFDDKSVQAILAEVFGKDSVASCCTIDSKSVIYSSLWHLPRLEVRKGVIVETEDGSVRCRSTFDEIVTELLELHGSELVSTLFCGGLPQ